MKSKILISSTCEDLGNIRHELGKFITDIGHESVMSDQDDVLYDPEQHTHRSCIEIVNACDMVVLLIGKRYGGKCVASALDSVDVESLNSELNMPEFLRNTRSLSITQVEILKAISCSIPIYTFVDEGVYKDHHAYEKNKNKTNMGSYEHPTMGQHCAEVEYIFSFISFIRKLPKNNSIKPYSNSSEIKGYLKEQWSQLFKKLLSERQRESHKDCSGDTSINANITIFEGTEGYLKILADIIARSQREVLFTSTRMANTNAEEPYGKLQKVIIDNSIEFKKRNPQRLHYGIIDSGSVETSSGSAELRAKVPDVVLRFNRELNSIKVNFLISDEEFVVLRMNKGGGGDRYSALIQNRHLALILKRYFYSLWEKSDFMREHLQHVVAKDENTLEDILATAGYEKAKDLIRFLDFLHDIDENNQSVPSKFIEKVIHVNNDYSVGHEQHIFDKYKQYCEKYVSKIGIELTHINEIRRKILSNNPIDYSKSSNAFFVQYFLSNYFKAKHSLECLAQSLNNTREIRVLDLGGGGGGSALAILDYVRNKEIGTLNFDIVDKSKEQMLITQELTGHKDDINYTICDAYDFLSNNELRYDLIFAGNFLCEAISQYSTRSMPELLSDALDTNGKLLVIERSESKVYENMEDSKLFKLSRYMYQNVRYKLPINNSYFEFIDEFSESYISDFIKKEYTLRYALYEL